MGGAVLMITITDRSRCGEFAAWYQEQGIPLVPVPLPRAVSTRAARPTAAPAATTIQFTFFIYFLVLLFGFLPPERPNGHSGTFQCSGGFWK